ncbi:MAG: hypothetical protein JZU65_04250 [Chlorobium sp.]|jgi:hypothetical protein|nr:hypothetical protein [Chlorobium sp.]
MNWAHIIREISDNIVTGVDEKEPFVIFGMSSNLNSRRKCNHGCHKSMKKRGAHGFSIAGHTNSFLNPKTRLDGWMAG